MTPERFRQIEELYHAAREDRAVLAQADPDLRREVESLLEQNVFQDGPLDRPAFAGMGSFLATDGSRLTPGTELGPYKIEGPLGQGGMGEVYRAHDPRLNRDVAIKVSAAHFSERFEREAKAIAALNHANICQIYDVGPNYLVMELIEGKSPQGPMPVEQVERIALQIADALEAAHEKGITHRDLKPANIKIKPDGMVKVLDFGLAKVTAAPVAGETSPTITIGVTEAGMILGTAAYMAPEQARGQQVDKRADIWSFGVVVWELLTGERLFQGESAADVLGKVLERDIDLGRVPVKFRRLLARCLDRNVKDRLRDIGEARFLLDAPQTLPAPAPLKWLWPAAVAVFALTALALGYAQYRNVTEEPPRVGKFSLLAPDKMKGDSSAALPAISPDGRRVAMALFQGVESTLWVRELDGSSFSMLPGTDGAESPFWSPDSRSIGFFAGSKLKRIDATGGPARTLSEAPDNRGATWSQDGVIVYGTGAAGLFRVSAEGGTPEALTEPNLGAGEVNHRRPWFLPDGQHFLFTARGADGAKTRVYVDRIDARPGSHTRREVLAEDSNAIYVPSMTRASGFSEQGYLLFMHDRALMAQPFDPAKGRTTGNVMPVAEGVDFIPYSSQGQFSASRNGTIVFTSGALSWEKVQLTWVNRAGQKTATVGSPASTGTVQLSPDGMKVATSQVDASGKIDLWLHDVERGVASRFTFSPGVNISPVWSPDGSRIGYYSLNGSGKTYLKAINGIGAEELTYSDPRSNWITDWSRDGRYLIESVIDPKAGTGTDIWVVPQFGDKKPYAYIRTEYDERNARLSPNGQWLAYISNESKRTEIYVQTFPEHGGKWQISTNGGTWPVWSRDGRELYFIGPDRKLMAVEVKGSGKGFHAGVPKPLFEIPLPSTCACGLAMPFDVSQDGRFLVQVPVGQDSSLPLTVVTNWQTGLKK